MFLTFANAFDLLNILGVQLHSKRSVTQQEVSPGEIGEGGGVWARKEGGLGSGQG